MFDQALFRPSFLQHIDPRVRMACAGGLALCLSPLRGLAACGAGLALGALLLLLARPCRRPLLHRLAAVNVFVLFLWCVTPLTTPGAELARWGLFSISAEGVRLSLLVSLKANAIACAFLALACSMSAPEAGHALERLHCPRKLVFLFLFTARYVHVIAQEWRVLLAAAKLRGFRPRTDARTYRTLASLLGLLLVRSHARAKRVHEAMLLRGFTGRFRSVTVFRARAGDLCFALALLLGAAGVLATEFLGGTYA
ncbi:MAG: cobalt ECF transporter T component CbiQ [Desulfovibrio desulfuricans]|nr:cobalt ECF transporter T component CbiQ [Desulfovibrio desulfuricans]